MKPLIVTITGPSSSGKTVLSHDLNDRGFKALISTTTRAKRAGEEDGVAYHFVTEDTFKQMEADNALIESIHYNGNHYGISRQEAVDSFAMGKSAALVVEPHGVEQVTRYCHDQGWEILRVFVYNPADVLIDRMLHRVIEDAQKSAGLPEVAPERLAAVVAESRPAILKCDPALNLSGNVKALVAGAVWNALGVSVDDNAAVAKCVDTHSSRMSNVLGFEQKEWVEPAVSGKAAYDLIFSSFNETNREAIIQKVREAADLLIHDEALDDTPEAPQRARRARRVS